MIINLNLKGKNVIIIGGGNESLKRIKSLLGEGCKITIISKEASPDIRRIAADGKAKLELQNVQDMKFFTKYKPDLVITTTNEYELNQKIICHAKGKKIMAYSSDSPESSDYANLAVADIGDMVHVAVFTGGKSPAMAKKLLARIRNNMPDMISDNDMIQIKIQDIARNLAKEKIPSQKDRKAFLAGIIKDRKIKQLIKDRMFDKAEDRVIAMLGDRG